MRFAKHKEEFGFTFGFGRLVFQLSSKDMWIFPKIDFNYLKGKMILAGWMIFYVGFIK